MGEEIVKGCFVGAAVPCAGDQAVWITSAGDNVAMIFLALRGFAGAGCVGDYVETESLCYAASLGLLVSAIDSWERRRTLSSNGSVSQDTQTLSHSISYISQRLMRTPNMLLLPFHQQLLLVRSTENL